MTELARGAHDVVRGFQFLNRHPRLWAYVIAPAIVTLALLVAGIAGLIHLVVTRIDGLIGALPGPLHGVAGALLWLALVAALAVGAWLVFVTVVGVVAGPFNELLSEAIEARVTGRPAPPFSAVAFARGALVGLVHGVRRLAVALAGFVIVVALGALPVVGTIAGAALAGWLAARAAAYDCYDAVLARRELRYRAKLAYLAHHRARSLGLGAAVAGLLVVPGLNLVALGLGAAGATLATAPE